MGRFILYGNGAEAALLDVVRADISRASPALHQPENCLLGPKRWQKVGHLAPSAAWDLLSPKISAESTLFGSHGDSVEYRDIFLDPPNSSLALVSPAQVTWIVQSREGRRRLYAAFTIDGGPYRLSITDPVWFQRLASLEEEGHERNVAGLTQDNRLLFTISLGEPFGPQQRCFKLVAGVVVLPGAV
ncbi:MAG: hypothetical protein HY681_14330 [Chloroflexi bacterium]|nr:hypothetical protein [Chloroflexota bacterium]